MPPPNITRHVGSRWEVRDDRGRWLPIEAPLDRASRDAERVRGWLASDDRDFVVRVYAAIVTDDKTIDRTPACAVVASAELADWIVALPAQRGLNEERRERLAEAIAEVAAQNRALATSPPASQARHGMVRVVGEPGLEPGTGGI